VNNQLDKKVITLTKEDGDFKVYFDMLEEHVIPTISNKSMDGRKLPKEIAVYYFNDNWKDENLNELVSLYPILRRLDTDETTPLLDGCTLDQTALITSALVSVYDMFMLEVAGSPRTKNGYDVEERYFDILYHLAFETDIHLSAVNSNDTLLIEKIKKGAAKGGQALRKDNLPFKEKYRAIRDSVEHQGKSREKHIDLAGVAFDAPFSSLERWAKEADKEDGFIRKAGRPSNKKG